MERGLNLLGKNRICTLLGISYPIIQGGMLWIAAAELASAISNAGCLGVVSPYAGMKVDGDPVETLRLQIKKTRKLTRAPFGVNIPLDFDLSGIFINAAIEEDVEIVITSGGDPRLYAELFQSKNIKVLHLVSSVRQARVAESCGICAIIAVGCEAAGRIGTDEIPLFSLLPQISDAVSIPIIAAGGIADGRGIAAAFVLGADGVQLGTRFVAVNECTAHYKYKQAIVAADDTGTIVTRRHLIPTRSLKSDFAISLSDQEKSGASSQKVSNFIGHGRARKALVDGDLLKGDAYAGSSVGLVKDIVPTAVVVQRLMVEYRRTIDRIFRK